MKMLAAVGTSLPQTCTTSPVFKNFPTSILSIHKCIHSKVKEVKGRVTHEKNLKLLRKGEKTQASEKIYGS